MTVRGTIEHVLRYNNRDYYTADSFSLIMQRTHVGYRIYSGLPCTGSTGIIGQYYRPRLEYTLLIGCRGSLQQLVQPALRIANATIVTTITYTLSGSDDSDGRRSALRDDVDAAV